MLPSVFSALMTGVAAAAQGGRRQALVLLAAGLAVGGPPDGVDLGAVLDHQDAID